MELYATLGPACRGVDTLRELFRAGMTAVRLNLSHTALEDCAEALSELRAAAEAEDASVRLVIDMQGPEVRIGNLEEPLELKEGAIVTLGTGGVPVPLRVIEAAEAGAQITLDDSAFLLKAEEKTADALRCRVLRGGVLQSRKSLALPGLTLDMPALTETDRKNLRAAGRFGVTDVLQPFVRGAEDVYAVREALREAGLDGVRVMAKIENRTGLDRLGEIIAAADELCIARGDLGNAMPLWELPRVQKEIAARCRKAGKPFCVATQLLWSMHERAVPTRAEVLDIYNAVLDGAAGLMLTGETAAGRYPAEAMRYLANTAREAEKAV